MPSIPRIPGFDHTLALLRDPYRFISNQCRALGSDIVDARFLLQRTICMSGAPAAALFYGSDRLIRRGAAPGRIEKTLVGKDGVQGLDDETHRHRKQMFLALVTPERVRELGALSETGWRQCSRNWMTQRRTVLYSEVRRLLMRAVCDWAGVPLPEADLRRRTDEVAAMFDYAGTVGPKHWWARLARRRSERWMRQVIEDIRSGRLRRPENSAAWAIANHRDLAGNPLPTAVAAVELLNVLRPTVAVAVYLVLAAHALQWHPDCVRRIADGDHDYLIGFVQEVRRYYPFFPAAIARVRRDCDWQGYALPQGCRVLMDLYGTNHDPRSWESPGEFRPERFRGWKGDPYSFIPQGGGDPQLSHRCPGEGIAVELMAVAARFLARNLIYTVPPQDLDLDFARMPALPRSRFIISEIVWR